MSTPPALRQDAATIRLLGLAHATSHFLQMLLVRFFSVFKQQIDSSYFQIGFFIAAAITAVNAMGYSSWVLVIMVKNTTPV